MIKLKKIYKSYGPNVIMENINLSIEPGKFTTLLGANGAGKSTLLKVMAGYELPDKGEALYKGESLHSLNFKHVHDISFIHELIDFYTGYNINKFLHIFTGQIPGWDEVFFRRMAKERKLDLNKNFLQCSRGQKMQIALMIALASNSPVLLIDEITAVIDVYGRKYFLDLLDQHVAKGNTVVMTTNIISELEFFSDRLVILKNKKIQLNEDVSKIPVRFIKLRRVKGEDHEIFHHENCAWAGLNSDRSISYVAPIELVTQYELPQNFFDRRQSSMEDIFIYFFSKEGDINENAA